jgi:hypothetical protein
MHEILVDLLNIETFRKHYIYQIVKMAEIRKGRDHLGDWGLDMRIILKSILNI